jgi:thiamine biosynthesis lipoprotein
MGTYYKVRIADSMPSQVADALKIEIDDLLSKVNQKMSTYLSESELSLFNKGGTEWTEMSPETFTVIYYGLGLSRKTDGAYDITAGPLVNLWGFGPKKKQEVPGQMKIDKVKETVGYHLLEAREKGHKLRKKHKDVYVDLSSLAKGYGVDKVSMFLMQKGLKNHLVEIGGEIKVSGQKNKKGAAWRIGIETPKKGSSPGDSLNLIVPLKDAAMATSGNYRNFFKVKDKSYSHTIDPRTGKPVEHLLFSVSVVARDCMEADAWATALMVLGPEKGFEFATQNNIKAHFIYGANKGIQTRSTESFQKLLR